MTCRKKIIEKRMDELVELFDLDGKSSPWSQSISPKECGKIFEKIYKNLQNTQEKYYQQIFLGFEDKYPLWTGYAIGYQITKSFLVKHKKHVLDRHYKNKNRRYPY